MAGRSPTSILRVLRRAAKTASLLEELLDTALYELAQIESRAEENACADTPLVWDAWKPLAKPISSLTISLRGDGSGLISFDNNTPFDLSPKLTQLLLLAASGPPDPDSQGVVSYRFASEVAGALSIDKGALFNLVFRLRRKLLKSGWNPFLLQTNRSSPESQIRFLTTKLVVMKDS